MESQEMQNHARTPLFCLTDLFLFKPCCGIRLEIAIKIIAVINMIVGVFMGLVALFGLVFFCLRTQEMLQMLRNNAYEPLALLYRLGPVFLASLLFLLIVIAMVLYLIGLLLWIAAKEYCYDDVTHWWNISLTLATINAIVNFIYWIVFSTKEFGLIMLQTMDPVVIFIILLVVNCFRKKHKRPYDEEIARSDTY